MGLVEGILAAIVALVGALKLFDKWFSKSSIEKEEKAKEEVHEKYEKLLKNRPPDSAP